jgi:cbb3-type cytochrome oxidase cytochrome c subunit
LSAWPQVKDLSEMDALIAYLQMLGTNNSRYAQ